MPSASDSRQPYRSSNFDFVRVHEQLAFLLQCVAGMDSATAGVETTRASTGQGTARIGRALYPYSLACSTIQILPVVSDAVMYRYPPATSFVAAAPSAARRRG